MENCIEIKELNKFYGKKKQALSNVNLTIEQGMFGLLGRNGAGKTTLLKCLLGLLPWSSGASFFNGRDRREWSTRECLAPHSVCAAGSSVCVRPVDSARTGCARQKRENRRLLAAEPHRLDGLRPCHGACRYPCAG